MIIIFMNQSFSISITLTFCLSKVSLIRGKDDGFDSTEIIYKKLVVLPTSQCV